MYGVREVIGTRTAPGILWNFLIPVREGEVNSNVMSCVTHTCDGSKWFPVQPCCCFTFHCMSVILVRGASYLTETISICECDFDQAPLSCLVLRLVSYEINIMKLFMFRVALARTICKYALR